MIAEVEGKSLKAALGQSARDRMPILQRPQQAVEEHKRWPIAKNLKVQIHSWNISSAQTAAKG